MTRASKKSESTRNLSVDEPACAVQLGITDLRRLAEPLFGIPCSLRLDLEGALGLTLPDCDVGSLVPNFDVTLLLTAELIDPLTVRFSVDMSGFGGWMVKSVQVVGGLPWLVSKFAAHAAFTVRNTGHVDLHLDCLPGDAAEWLTNRGVLRSCSIPGEGKSAATVTFTIKRFMTVV